MLTKPTDKETLAFARLVRSDDGKVFVEYAARAVADIKDRLVSADSDATIRRFQGRAEALRDLVEALESAPDLVVKLESRARSRQG
jgi:hypothetical protein